MNSCCQGIEDSIRMKDRDMFEMTMRKVAKRDIRGCTRCQKMANDLKLGRKEEVKKSLRNIRDKMPYKPLPTSYYKHIKKDRYIVCARCKQEKEYHSKGFCRKCYEWVIKNYKKTTEKRCWVCESPNHYSMGYCADCYSKNIRHERSLRNEKSRENQSPKELHPERQGAAND